MTEALGEGAETKLAQMARLLALSVTRGLPQTEQITLLSRAGLSVSEIAELVNTTPNTVSVTLYAARKKQRKR